MSTPAVHERRSFIWNLASWKAAAVIFLVAVAMLTQEALRQFFLGMLAMGVIFVVLARLGRREISLTAPRGVLEGGEAAPPRQPHPLYDPSNVRPYGPAGAYLTQHPVGALLALGLGFILFAGVPDARQFLLGALLAGVAVGLILWLRSR